MKTRGSNETVCGFLTTITKKNRPKKSWVDKGTEFAAKFKKLCKAEGIKLYSSRSETKAAFSEHTTQSLKNILYCYMEDNGYKYIHNLSQFVTTLNSRRNCSIDLIPWNVNSSDFSSILYSRALRQFRKLKIIIGDRVRISKYDLLFRKAYMPQVTQRVIEINAISSRMPPSYTIKDEQDETIRGKFYEKELTKVN